MAERMPTGSEIAPGCQALLQVLPPEKLSPEAVQFVLEHDSGVLGPALELRLGHVPDGSTSGDIFRYADTVSIIDELPDDPVSAQAVLGKQLARDKSDLDKWREELDAEVASAKSEERFTEVADIKDEVERVEALRSLKDWEDFKTEGLLWVELRQLRAVLRLAAALNRGYTTNDCLEYYRQTRIRLAKGDWRSGPVLWRDSSSPKELTVSTGDAEPLNDAAVKITKTIALGTYKSAEKGGEFLEKVTERLKASPRNRLVAAAAAFSLLVGDTINIAPRSSDQFIAASGLMAAGGGFGENQQQSLLPGHPSAETEQAQEALMPESVSDELIEIIKDSEGWVPHLYNDPSPARNATIGYGHLVHPGPINGSEPEEFKRGLTEEQGEELLKEDIARFEAAVHELVTVPLTQHQFDALVSFAYNVGIGAFERSNLLELLKQGQYEAIPEQLQRWVRADGKVLRGLISRRNQEIELWQRQPLPPQIAQASLAAPQSAEPAGLAVPETVMPLDANISGLEIKDRLMQKYNQVSGHLEVSELEALGGIWEGHSLHPAAAHNFRDLAAAFKAHFGRDLGLEASYRSYDKQVSLKNSPRAAFAANPGESDHGWGLAIDGASANNLNKFDSEEYQWMSENAHLYGWINPEKLRDGKGLDESWHWVYVGAPDALKLRGGPPGDKKATRPAVRIKVRSGPLNLPPIEIGIVDQGH